MGTAADLLAAADPDGALAALQQQVRAAPQDAALRVFLFQLLAVTGQWQRAATQLQVCGELDAGTLAMVATYRDALPGEALREAVFAGRTTPVVFGRPQPWVAWLVEALQADARGDTAGARALRERAFDEAPATPGEADGQAFDWIADADSRLGPVLEAVIQGRYAWVPFDALTEVDIEAPADLRDLVWAPARLGFVNGGEAMALVPVRYAGTAAQGDGALRLSRRTDWAPLDEAAGHWRGLGQRVLTTSAGDLDLLGLRQLRLRPAPAAEPGAQADGGAAAAPVDPTA